jgi:3-dehydroquinate synthase
VRIGWLGKGDAARVVELLGRAGLPTEAAGLAVDEVLDRMRLDKKAGRKGMRLVLLKALGKAELTPAPDDSILREAIAAGLSASPRGAR